MATEAACELALDQYSSMLEHLPNVVGIGIGVADESNSEDLALMVYVRKKSPKTELDAESIIPKSFAVTQEDETVIVPVQVLEIGEIQPE